MLIDVRNDVLVATRDEQRPFDYSALREPIYLAGRTSEALVRTGTIYISSDVKGAVYLDGEPKGTVREDGTCEIKVQNGSYILEVKAEFFTFKTKVTVKSEQETPVKVKSGILELYSEIAGELYINNKSFGSVKENEKRTISKLLGLCKVTLRTEDGNALKEEKTVKANESVFIFIKKPEKVTTVTDNEKDSYSKKYNSFYAFGFYGSYNLGVSPIYSQSGSTSTADDVSTNPIKALKPIVNKKGSGSVGLTWTLIYTNNGFDCQFFTGYTYYHVSFGENERITHHEFDVLGLKIGGGRRTVPKFHVNFHIGLQLYSHWKIIYNASIPEKEKQKIYGTPHVGLAPLCDLEVVVADYFSIYAEYKPKFTFFNTPPGSVTTIPQYRLSIYSILESMSIFVRRGLKNEEIYYCIIDHIFKCIM